MLFLLLLLFVLRTVLICDVRCHTTHLFFFNSQELLLILTILCLCVLWLQQLLLCATQSLFACDSSSSSGNGGGGSGAGGMQRGSPTSLQATPPPAPPLLDCKTNPPTFVFVQGWQLLALAVSLFVPRNNRLLWYLKLHLHRNVDPKQVFESKLWSSGFLHSVVMWMYTNCFGGTYYFSFQGWTLVLHTNKTIWQNYAEDCNLNSYHHEKLKSQVNESCFMFLYLKASLQKTRNFISWWYVLLFLELKEEVQIMFTFQWLYNYRK